MFIFGLAVYNLVRIRKLAGPRGERWNGDKPCASPRDAASGAEPAGIGGSSQHFRGNELVLFTRFPQPARRQGREVLRVERNDTIAVVEQINAAAVAH